MLAKFLKVSQVEWAMQFIVAHPIPPLT